jgi:molybdopterin synthase sulfur carrier subunit
MARLLLLGPAREAAGRSNDIIEGSTIAQVLEGAVERYGDNFGQVLAISQIWLNGEPADVSNAVASRDEIAVLPPVSGG